MTSTQERKSGALLFRSYRKQRKQTQQSLAHRLGVSRSMVAQIEQGERIPSRKLLSAVSTALHLSDDDEALLFVSFGKLPQNKHLACVKALIQCDNTLSTEQANKLIALLTSTYQQYRETN